LENENFLFSGNFAPPENVTGIALGFRQLIKEKAGYVYIGLNDFENTYISNPPNSTSLSMRMFGDSSSSYTRLFIPLTDVEYKRWIEHCVKRFSREFGYQAN
jgi:hypothetical protein